MLFTSIEYFLFLPTVFILYWFVFSNSLRLQNLLILSASYFFYGWWDWRFLSLIIFSSTVDYVIGLKIENANTQVKRKIFLFISIFTNIGLLASFKYFNFFIESFADLFSSIGIDLNVTSLNIILPIGISFYTFQSLSYSIDIYNKRIKPRTDIVAFFSFVSFFPQLVAGPIERAKNLLPQFETKRIFNYELARDGLRQILWGLFKKIVIADTCAIQADYIFENHESLSGSILLLGAIYFAFQIYCDFSAYSDIAIGTARLFGFNLMRNFALPYFSRDIAEFWRRWHISLSTWFRDYVYIPLGGSHSNKVLHIRNLMMTFTISGFWHGANWNFIFWGFLNSLYYIPLIFRNKQKDYKDIVALGKAFPSLVETYQILSTFLLILFAWVFFRSTDIHHAFLYLKNLFSNNFFYVPKVDYVAVLLILFLLVSEWVQRDKMHVLQIDKLPIILRWSIYFVLTIIILLFIKHTKTFIYFQF